MTIAAFTWRSLRKVSAVSPFPGHEPHLSQAQQPIPSVPNDTGPDVPHRFGAGSLETESFLRSNGTFQFLTGLPGFPDPQTLRRFLHHAPDVFWQQMHRVDDRLLQTFIHLPAQRSRLIFDLDSTVVTVFGNQEDAAVGYSPRYRGKKSYDPLLCMEANSSFLWDAELRPGNAGTWDGSLEVLETSFANVPLQIRELRVRADAGFGFNPVFAALEARPAQYAVTARLTPAFKRLLPGVSYEPVNRKWEMAEFEHRLHGWPQARRVMVARRFIQKEEAETTLFSMGRFIYRNSSGGPSDFSELLLQSISF